MRTEWRNTDYSSHAVGACGYHVITGSQAVCEECESGSAKDVKQYPKRFESVDQALQVDACCVTTSKTIISVRQT